ncbi:Y-family DNA polymerase [Sphingomonas sanguinis]|uniref:Y-family DNA polymerase n=1 Tax=Sphingomonas sanguinis TaxID=33051 RepID=UPI001F4C7983|nr:DNA polymerase Y family protein [Sphingomonas sanguinis]
MTRKASIPRRYLALVFPWLPIERLRARRPHLFVARGDAPIAFAESVGGAIRLAALDPAAVAAGLSVGLSLADARARVPEIEIYPHDPAADADWLERLAEGARRYSPAVALDPPQGLVLDSAGSDHLYGGERGLAEDIEMRMARRGLTVRLAYGDTPEAARALARHAGAPAPDEMGAIRRLPVAALELDEDGCAALVAAGLKSVGDVLARPMATIAARFGREAAIALRRLTGEEDSPLTPRVVAAPIGVERRFAEPVARTEHMLGVLEELAGEAARRLEERHEGGRRWDARLFRADGEVQGLRVETGQPTRDPAVLLRLFRERIEALADPLDPGFGYDLIRLDVGLAEKLDAVQLRLEGGEAKSEAVAALIDRLGTRLGRERVRRIHPRDSHIPEQAELLLPATETAPKAEWTPPQPGEPPSRPIHLFDPPQPIESLAAETPDGPPARFRWRRKLHDVARAEGPERIAGEWWRRADMAPPTRDYYRVEDVRGRRFWIFRHGLYSETERPRWYVHGLFA